MNIIFMRHGEAIDNIKKVISDKEIYWSILTPNGVNMVQETVEALPKNIDKMYVSPLPRTIQTANLVYTRYPCLNIEIDNRIRESFHGKYSGQENNEDLDNVRKMQIAGDYFVRFGDYGENKWEIEWRLTNFLKDIKENNNMDSTILVVSHGSIISHMKRILGFKTPHIQTGKTEEFCDVDFGNVYANLELLEKIRRID